MGKGVLSKSTGSVTISDALTSIADNAFKDCENLTNIEIPESVTSIGWSAFSGCSSLTSIIIPDSVTSIGSDAFRFCSEALTIYGTADSYAETYAQENNIKFSPITPSETEQPAGKKTISGNNVTLSQTTYTYDGTAKTPAVTVKDGNTTLTAGTDYTVAYADNTNVGTATVTVTGTGNYEGTVTKNFTIKAAVTPDPEPTQPETPNQPAAAKTISDNNVALSQTSYTYDGTVTKNFTITVEKNTSHKVGAYQYKVTGASTVSVTGMDDKKATKVKISKTVTIGGQQFNITAIGNKAFKKNTKITSVEIGDNVKTIGTSAFEGCTKLSKATVGKGVTEIEGSAFKNCKKLGTLTIKSTKLKKSGENALTGIKSTAKVKVPSNKMSDYQKLFKNKGQGKKVKITK